MIRDIMSRFAACAPAMLAAVLVAMSAGCGGSTTSDDTGDVSADTAHPTDVVEVTGHDGVADARDATAVDVPADTLTDDGTADVTGDAADDSGHTLDVPYPDVPYPDVPEDAGIDITTDANQDATTECGAWELVNVALEGAGLHDPVAPTAARTVRISATAILKCNQDRAIPVVTVDTATRTITIQPRQWEFPIDCMGPDQLDARIIPVVPDAAGEWQVKDPEGDVKLTFDVGEAPEWDCLHDSMSNCDSDCDCAEGVCLGGWGLVGPFTMCALPCEEDRDCPSGNSCISADDGLDHYCDPTQNCLDTTDCPTGFVCESKFCVADYTLNQTTRHVCNCPADCEPPLRCVAPSDPGGLRRCEYACPTAGNWCAAGHVCGPAKDDVSGLAETDSVCGWIGE